MNHCSHWTRFYSHPSYRDFDLAAEGLRYVFPEGSEGMVFEDGSSFIGFGAYRVVDEATGRAERWEEGIERTLEQIRRFSRRDADTYLRLLEAFETHWKAAFRRHRFSAPPPWGEPDALEELLAIPDSHIEPVHQFMTTRQLAYDFFESDELRVLFMRAATTSTGCFPDDVPGLQGLIHNLPLVLSFEPAAIAVGGSQAISDALVSAGRKLGVEYFTSQEVAAISVDGDRATGIVLADGSTVAADIVVSGLGLPQTVLRCSTATTSRSACAGASRTSTTTAASSSGPTSRCTSRRSTWRPRPTPASARSRACTGGRRIPTTSRCATSPRCSCAATPSGCSC